MCMCRAPGLFYNYIVLIGIYKELYFVELNYIYLFAAFLYSKPWCSNRTCSFNLHLCTGYLSWVQCHRWCVRYDQKSPVMWPMSHPSQLLQMCDPTCDFTNTLQCFHHLELTRKVPQCTSQPLCDLQSCTLYPTKLRLHCLWSQSLIQLWIPSETCDQQHLQFRKLLSI